MEINFIKKRLPKRTENKILPLKHQNPKIHKNLLINSL